MGFEGKQIRKLRARLRPEHVRSREADGITLHYLEGWHVVAEANRIFGFDGWERETVATQCVWTKQVGQRFQVDYLTRVRVRVYAGNRVITREGSGAGEASAPTAGAAHEMAAKAAETDATKRALSTFGNAFGLSLYGGAPPAERPQVKDSRGDVSKASVDPGREVPGSDNEHLAPSEGPAGAEAGQGETSGQPVAQEPEPMPPIGEPTVSVDKSELYRGEVKRRRDLGHLKHVASQPCIVCGREPCDAHHLRFAQPTAMGRKVSDEFTVPLCRLHHRELHDHGDERRFWRRRGINPLPKAKDLWNESHGWKVDAVTPPDLMRESSEATFGSDFAGVNNEA